MTNYSRSVLKSNGFHHSENLPVKFVFSSKTVPANIVKKLPSQRCFKPLLIAIFNFSHKRPTFAFTSKSGYTLTFANRIAHSGSQGETRGVSGGGRSHYPRTVSHGSEPLRAQRSEEHTLPSLHGPRECRREAESLRCGILHCTNELRGFAIVMTECGEKFC